MARFSGNVGFAVTGEIRPGIYDNTVTERKYVGDLIRRSIRNQSSGNVNDNIIVSNEISIIADIFANKNYSNIIYVELNGVKLKVTSVTIQYPRLVLSVGDVYNG